MRVRVLLVVVVGIGEGLPIRLVITSIAQKLLRELALLIALLFVKAHLDQNDNQIDESASDSDVSKRLGLKEASLLLIVGRNVHFIDDG